MSRLRLMEVSCFRDNSGKLPQSFNAIFRGEDGGICNDIHHMFEPSGKFSSLWEEMERALIAHIRISLGPGTPHDVEEFYKDEE